MTMLSIDVVGTPVSQGSKRHVGGGRMIESSAALKPWREAVKYAALEAIERHVRIFGSYPLMTGPVRVRVVFTFTRPKGHWRTGRYSHLLRDSAPVFPAVKPDIEKCERAIFDALTDAGVWRDDAQVVHLISCKRYADGDEPANASLIIREIPR